MVWEDICKEYAGQYIGITNVEREGERIVAASVVLTKEDFTHDEITQIASQTKGKIITVTIPK